VRSGLDQEAFFEMIFICIKPDTPAAMPIAE